MSISTLIALIFFIYVAGASWTLIGLILMDDPRMSQSIKTDVQFVAFWPMTWVFTVTLVVLVVGSAAYERLEDLADDIRIKWNNR